MGRRTPTATHPAGSMATMELIANSKEFLVMVQAEGQVYYNLHFTLFAVVKAITATGFGAGHEFQKSG